MGFAVELRYAIDSQRTVSNKTATPFVDVFLLRMCIQTHAHEIVQPASGLDDVPSSVATSRLRTTVSDFHSVRDGLLI